MKQATEIDLSTGFSMLCLLHEFLVCDYLSESPCFGQADMVRFLKLAVDPSNKFGVLFRKSIIACSTLWISLSSSHEVKLVPQNLISHLSVKLLSDATGLHTYLNFNPKFRCFDLCQDIVVLYLDRISVSFTIITKSSLLFKHIFKEEKYFVVYSDYFWSITGIGAPLDWVL